MSIRWASVSRSSGTKSSQDTLLSPGTVRKPRIKSSLRRDITLPSITSREGVNAPVGSRLRNRSPSYCRRNIVSGQQSDRECFNVLLGRNKPEFSRVSSASSEICLAVHPAIQLNRRSISTLSEIRKSNVAKIYLGHYDTKISQSTCLNVAPVTDTHWEKRVCELIESCSLESEQIPHKVSSRRQLGHVISRRRIMNLLTGPESYFTKLVANIPTVGC